MTDAPNALAGVQPRRIDMRSPDAKARLRARYRADTRFRWYGIGALAIASAFLCVLLADIFIKGMPAFWQHSLQLEIPLAADVIDPEKKGDARTLLGADYLALARKAISAAVPGLEGRSERKQLNELLSSGAIDQLRTQVAANPALVGQTIKAQLLLSDTADLYLKGRATPVTEIAPPKGTAIASGTSGEVTLVSDTADFASPLSAVQDDLRLQAKALTLEAERLERGSTAGAAEKIAELRARATGLEARASDPGSQSLDSNVPSWVVAINGGIIKVTSLSQASVTGETLIPLTSTAAAKPGSWQVSTYATPEANRKITDRSVAFLEHLKAGGLVQKNFNWLFFTAGDSREPELAGIRGAVFGSLLTLLVTLGVCLPVGVMAAIYLEKFAPKNRLTDLVEINVNNLAAVPSIVFGLLGLAVFLNYFGMPRSAPLVGGLVLALLVLPTIIITARAALKAVPPSIEEAALGVGASKQQAIFHHVLPLAMPGIMTGTIIGMAHALGETAPLLMIGMVAFIVDVPTSLTDSATALPVQIYLWSDLPEQAFQAKTAAAIIVLLAVLFAMNGTAIWLRKKFERRW